MWIAASETCELCDIACSSCNDVYFDSCINCALGRYKIQPVCNSFCPTGYIVNGANCDLDPS